MLSPSQGDQLLIACMVRQRRKRTTIAIAAGAADGRRRAAHLARAAGLDVARLAAAAAVFGRGDHVFDVRGFVLLTSVCLRRAGCANEPVAGW